MSPYNLWKAMYSVRGHNRKRIAPILIVCLLLLLALATLGQSGRRGSKSPAIPVPSPEEKQLETKPGAELTKIPLAVGASSNDSFMGVPFNIYDSVLQSCARRLGDSHSVQVEMVTKGLSRSEAIERAKSAKEGYVIWLYLRGDDLSASYSVNLDSIFIEYFVFEHTTAKVKAQGNSYQGAYRRGGVVTGSPTVRSNNTVAEARLRAAAEDAAERILKALHFASGSDIPTHE